MTSFPTFLVLRRVTVCCVRMAIVIFVWLASRSGPAARKSRVDVHMASARHRVRIHCDRGSISPAILRLGAHSALRSVCAKTTGFVCAYMVVVLLYRYVPGKILCSSNEHASARSSTYLTASGAVLPVIETIVALLAGSAVSLLSVSYYASTADELLPELQWRPCLFFLIPDGYRRITRLPFSRNRYPDLQSIDLGTADILVFRLPILRTHLLLGVAFFLIARSVYPLTWPELPGLCGIYAMSHVISVIVVVAPGGIGVREGAFAMQLAHAVPVGLASALAVAVRVAFTLIELLCFLSIVHLQSHRDRPYLLPASAWNSYDCRGDRPSHRIKPGAFKCQRRTSLPLSACRDLSR